MHKRQDKNKYSEPGPFLSRKHMLDLINSAKDWFWECDKNGIYTFSSPQVEKRLGYTPQEIIGKEMVDLMTEKQAIKFTKIFKEISVKEESLLNYEHEHKHKDGRTIIMEADYLPFYDDKGNYQGYRGIDRDVTERVRVREELKQSEKNFKNLIQNLPIGIVVSLPGGEILEANEIILRIFGFSSKEEFIKQKAQSRYKDPNDRKRFLELAKKGDVKDFEAVFKRRDGSTFFGSLSTIAQLTKKGKPIFLNTVQDITERRREEEALMESEERFRKVFEEGPLGIVLLGKDKHFIRVNSMFSKMLGYSQEELIKMSFADVTFPEDIEMSIKYADNLFLGKVPIVKFEKRYVKKDGGIIWARLTSSLVKDEKRRIMYALSMFEDVTKRKKADAELRNGYQRERKISETLQKSLMPFDIPKIKDLEVKFFYQSASEEAEVGGDFYDIFRIASGSYGIVIGDVSGKGIGAATEIARVKYLLRDRAYYETKANLVLSKVNNALIKQKVKHFIALSYCIFNPETSILEISNAGNPYPYEVSNDLFTKITGVPLGIIPKESYLPAKLLLKKGDVIVLTTDGLIEARHNGHFFGEQGLRSYIKSNESLSLKMLLSGLVEEAKKLSKDKLIDDILLIGIRRK